MAPWPEVGNEPKAPDKNDSRDSVDTSPRDNSDDTSDSVVATRADQASKQSEEKEVLTLDEGQLKALLDEAITYKNPKDREGKSELFKELLQEAEADESDSKELGGSLTGKLPRGYYNLPSRKRHTRHQGRECGVGVSTTRGGSLQNLHALGMEGGGSGTGNRSGRSRRNGRSGETLVSARQREGGSLPSNVNVDNDPDLDSIICPNYTSRATLEVSGLRSEDSQSEKSSSIVSYSLVNGTEMVPVAPPSDTPCLTYNSTGTKDVEPDDIFIASSLLTVVYSWARLTQFLPNKETWDFLLSRKRIPPQLTTIMPDYTIGTILIYHPETLRLRPAPRNSFSALMYHGHYLSEEEQVVLENTIVRLINRHMPGPPSPPLLPLPKKRRRRRGKAQKPSTPPPPPQPIPETKPIIVTLEKRFKLRVGMELFFTARVYEEHYSPARCPLEDQTSNELEHLLSEAAMVKMKTRFNCEMPIKHPRSTLVMVNHERVAPGILGMSFSYDKSLFDTSNKLSEGVIFLTAKQWQPIQPHTKSRISSSRFEAYQMLKRLGRISEKLDHWLVRKYQDSTEMFLYSSRMKTWRGGRRTRRVVEVDPGETESEDKTHGRWLQLRRVVEVDPEETESEDESLRKPGLHRVVEVDPEETESEDKTHGRWLRLRHVVEVDPEETESEDETHGGWLRLGRVVEVDLDGRVVEVDLEGRVVEVDPEETESEDGTHRRWLRLRRVVVVDPEDRVVEVGPEDCVVEVDLEGRVVEVDHEGRVVEVDLEGRVVEVDHEGRVVEVDLEGRVVEVDHEGRVVEVDLEGRVVELDHEGRVVEVDPEGRVVEVDPEGRVVEVGPEGRVVEVDPEGRVVEVGPEGCVVEVGPEGRVVEVGPEGRVVEVDPEETESEDETHGRWLRLRRVDEKDPEETESEDETQNTVHQRKSGLLPTPSLSSLPDLLPTLGFLPRPGELPRPGLLPAPPISLLPMPNFPPRDFLEFPPGIVPRIPPDLKLKLQRFLEGQEITYPEGKMRKLVQSDLEGVGPIESGAMLYPPVPSPVQHVSVLSIPPSQIHTGPDPATRMATFGKESTEAKTKPVDENGNALGCTRGDSNCQDRKKQRRLKTKNEKNIRDFKSEEIEGFRGEADIETLMEYIESRPSNPNVVDGPKTSKSRPNQNQNAANGIRSTIRVRAKEEDSRPIKRRTKEKFQRCNSLEEISKTKLEDLTEESSSEKVNGNGSSLALQAPVKQVTLDDAELGKKSSWANRQADSHTNSGEKLVKTSETKSVVRRQKDQKLDKTSQEGVPDAEFHVVTKKQRKKKRRAGCSGRVGAKPVFPAHDRTLERSCGGASAAGLLYQCRGKSSGAAPRRKSASSVPPSDKSDSSDLDSVHSLPVSSTTSRTRVGKNSVSGGSTPAASYADIARSAASPPRGAISPPPPPGTTKRDAMTDMSCDKPALLNEEYPPLEVKTTDYFIDSLKTTSQASRDGSEKSSSKTVPVNTNVIVCSESGPCAIETDCSKAPGTVIITVKRPPVILMDELEPTAGSQVPTEITFGFEVNQQLLQSDDCATSFEPSASETSNIVSTPISSPPIVVTDPSLKRLIQYHSSAWEEVMKDLRLGKAMYYDGQ